MKKAIQYIGTVVATAALFTIGIGIANQSPVEAGPGRMSAAPADTDLTIDQQMFMVYVVEENRKMRNRIVSLEARTAYLEHLNGLAMRAHNENAKVLERIAKHLGIQTEKHDMMELDRSVAKKKKRDLEI